MEGLHIKSTPSPIPRRKSKNKQGEIVNPSSSSNGPSRDVVSLGTSSESDTKLSIVNSIENNMLRYEHVIEHYRKSEDFMWRFFDAKGEREFRDGHLRNFRDYLVSAYGGDRPPGTCLPESAFKTLDRIIKEDDDVLKNFLLFTELYLAPPIFTWFLEGIKEHNIPPPKLTDKERFRYFVTNILPKLYENLLSGTKLKSQRKGLDIPRFVAYASTELFATCGFPEIPPERRMQNYTQSQVDNASKQKKFSEIFPLGKSTSRKSSREEYEEDDDEDEEDDTQVKVKTAKVVTQKDNYSSDDSD